MSHFHDIRLAFGWRYKDLGWGSLFPGDVLYIRPVFRFDFHVKQTTVCIKSPWSFGEFVCNVPYFLVFRDNEDVRSTFWFVDPSFKQVRVILDYDTVNPVKSIDLSV